MKRIICLVLIFILVATSSYAHSGRTDSSGGHYNRKTGEYHYHGGSSAPRPTYIPQENNESYLDNEDRVEYIVYITRTGAKYHRGTCRYLKYSKFAVSKKEAISDGYLPCKVCRP